MMNPDTSDTHPATLPNGPDEPIGAVIRRVYEWYEAVNAPTGPTAPESGAPTIGDLVPVRELLVVEEALPGLSHYLVVKDAPVSQLRVWERRFQIVTAAELLATAPRPVSWVWDKLLPEGALAMLAAAPKVGKSTLAGDLAVAVAQGRPCAGFATKQCPVLIVAVEERRDDVRRRLERFGLRPTDPLYISGYATPEDLPAIRDAIERYGIELVILDTLTAYWAGFVSEENNNTETAKALRPFLDIARAGDVCVLLLHHHGKGDRRGTEAIRGASAVFALMDQAIQMFTVSDLDDPHRTLQVAGRYAGDSPRAVTLVLDGREYRRVEGGQKAAKDADAQSKVWAALPEPDSDPKEDDALATETGLDVKPVRAVLEALTDRGLVERTGLGKSKHPYLYRRAAPPA
jgi:hypothetical protein